MMPTKLSTNAIRYCCNKFTTKSYKKKQWIFIYYFENSYLIQMLIHEQILQDYFVYRTYPIRIDPLG